MSKLHLFHICIIVFVSYFAHVLGHRTRDWAQNGGWAWVLGRPFAVILGLGPGLGPQDMKRVIEKI